MRYTDPIRRLPGGEDRGPRRWSIRIALTLLIAAALAACVDWLAFMVSADVAPAAGFWLGSGAHQISPWDQGRSPKKRLRLTSLTLSITVNGDQISAQYELTAPVNSDLAAQARAVGGSDTGGDLVSNILGSVSVAEFRYGMTGPRHSMETLAFHGPQLTVSKGVATLVVNSDSVRLFLHRQQITIMKATGIDVRGPDLIKIENPGVQVLSASGAQLADPDKKGINLKRGQKIANIAVSTNSRHDWLAGLRAVGGITIPVVDGLFSRLSNLFVYFVFLWVFRTIRFALPYSRIAEVAYNITLTIVTALASLAFLAFMVDLGTALGSSDVARAEAATPET